MAEQLEQAEKQFVVFRLGGESYGVDIGKVKEIINMQTITAVPIRLFSSRESSTSAAR
jgi:purine-binding chemotaxis protein CheW